MKKAFNKLVRDKIPEIIEQNGDIPEIEILDDSAYAVMLEEKLLEEGNEVQAATTAEDKLEEIADMMEVIYAIVDNLGLTFEEVEKVRIDKKEKRGAFQNRILLKATISKEE